MLCVVAMTTCIAVTRACHISSNFLRCATLAPNMLGMFSRVAWDLGSGGGDRKGGRMKYYGTAPAFSIAPSNDPRLLCPQCQDLIIAATNSQHVSPNEVRHWWACEACGHEFCTTVQWESSPFQSVSAFEKTLA